MSSMTPKELLLQQQIEIEKLENEIIQAVKMVERISLHKTCWACPEQYDALLREADCVRKVGYLRLRHGCFTVEYPDVDGELLYEFEFDGDGLKGIFEDDERAMFLCEAKARLAIKILKETKTKVDQ